MKKLITIFLIFISLLTKAQNTFVAVIKNEDTKQPLQGASIQIKSLKLTEIANDEGVIILKNIPGGKQDIDISSIGYKEVEKTFNFPLNPSDTVPIFLKPVSYTH